ncbi:hypothetical protein CBER1_02222 [Cercospora berteroae]|uniref:alpha-1,2-Mannosidase n=1 Tax=Cercospora berteroae TaxID=357750 RepID=A0A2S6CB23_9PEZI|nr:hypothetical protein CBER1_02222 [Cercospora berteroae]
MPSWTAWAFTLLAATEAVALPEAQREPRDFLRPRQYGARCPDADYDTQCGTGDDYTGFTKDQQERADGIVDVFRHAWNGYYTYAFPNDDLLPKNNSFRNSRNGWGLTAIDGLDTAIIMEQQDIGDIVLDFVPTVDFTKNNAKGPQDAQTTSLFETDIRYLGGLLSAYDLLKGPFKHMAPDDAKADALLEQAKGAR